MRSHYLFHYPFFSGLLPDGDARKLIAKILGTSANNPFSLLYEIGGDCAGAVMLLPSGTSPTTSIEANLSPLSDQQLLSALAELPRHPLLANNTDMRLSLAGVQSKMAVHVNDDGICFANNTPTTHILKPAIVGYEDTVHNELFCMLLAKKMGLKVAGVSIRLIENTACLLVERYDR